MKFLSFIILLISCQSHEHKDKPYQDSSVVQIDTIRSVPNPVVKDSLPMQVNTGNVRIDSVLNFAQSLIGTPYRYASTDPLVGFDCSGFITYVFSHFNIKVPRSSYEFENVGQTIAVEQSKPGDLMLFTGTDSTEKTIGHMGIILSFDSSHIKFIHSSSGKANGVVITDFGKYYQSRFVKVVRIFTSP